MVNLKVKVYVEGGGDGSQLKTECRRAFSTFFEKAGLKDVMPKVVACGSRSNAYDDFCTALRTASADELPLLLVDSEAPVTVADPWKHLKQREGDQWDKPDKASDRHAHLMAQCMESWFLADRDAMSRFFGSEFNSDKLPANPKIEDVPKQTVFESLKAAIKNTKSGSYSKGRHSFRLLAQISPELVGLASPWAKRLLDTLRSAKAP